MNDEARLAYLKKLFSKVSDEVVDSFENVKYAPEDLLFLNVLRSQIEKGQIQAHLREFEKLGKRGSRSQVMFSVDGYDFDPRELYEIREVRNWFARLYKNVPHLFYFITPKNGNMRVIFCCLAEVQRMPDGSIGVMNNPVMVDRIVERAVSFSKKKGDRIEDQFLLANTILDEIGYR